MWCTGKRRCQKGQQMAEFSAALVLLIVGICIPLLNLAVMPLRWGLWQQGLNSDARKIAQSENFSSAIAALETDRSLSMRSSNISGAKLLSAKCALIITMLNSPGEVFIAEKPQTIEPAWLPDGKKSPCSYQLQITSDVAISPLFLLSGSKVKIPGLTEPFKCTTKALAHWENYGRDPATKRFFMNE